MKLSVKQVLIMLFCNYIPFLQALTLILFCYFNVPRYDIILLFALLWIYIIPPLVSRIMLGCFPIKSSKIKVFSKEYYIWWFVFCVQVIYLRLPFIEELLRFIPGMYSVWLRLWGAKVGKLVYWTPGTKILDRPFVQIGDFVSFGADVRINPHVIQEDELILAPVVIENNVCVGAYSLITAGTILKAYQCTKAFLISPPFSIWSNNKRERHDN